MRGLKSNGVSRGLRGLWFSLFVLLAGVAATFGNQARAQDAATSCVPAIGRVVSIQGNVEVQRAGTSGWLKLSRLDTALCAGDRLRTDALSRAALFLQPETLVRVDQNTTISVSQTTAEVLVEFHTDQVSQAAQNAQSCGAGYFITRFPRKFKVSTPHMNAAVEGTEFMVESSCKASTLTVLEGQVLSQSPGTQESQSLTAGQRIETDPASGSVLSTVVKPADAVQWVLRFPPLSDATTESGIPSEEQCRALPASTRPPCLTERAERLLSLGRAEEGLKAIDQALALDTDDSNAHSLRSIVQIAKNEKPAALESAERAVASDPSNSRGWLALSYARQASFELEAALGAARKAQELQENSSLVHTRVAELQLSLGYWREAEQSARAAIASNSAESYAHSVLGFVKLAQVQTEQARASFETAIARDSFAALPRLGLGLALIRDGMLEVGREQLEIAVALDPGSSLLRSYVGKAYYEENSRERDKLAATQLAIAAELDPNDPTPGLYGAIRLQTANRPVEALQQIRQSIELNDNRAIFRSQLKLDEDLAVRSASQGRIYRDLGFEKLAALDGSRSVNTDPGDFSGHRLLADTYSGLPRHEVARVNELFTSQLLQPQNLTPVPPQLGEANLFILESAGPTDVAFNEFNPLFTGDGWALHASATVGGNETWGNDIAIAAIEGPWSLSLGQFHFETDGFRPNNDLDQDVYNAFVQYRHSESTSLLMEVRSSRREQGDLQLLFNPDTFIPDLRATEDSDSARLGARHVFNPRSQLLASIVYQTLDHASVTPGVIDVSGTIDSYIGEIQYLYRGSSWRLTSGVRQSRRESLENLAVFFPEPSPEVQEFSFDSTSAYVYLNWNWNESLSLLAGASADFLEGRTIDEDRVNPKFGITWKPTSRSVVRIMATRTIQPDAFSKQDIPPRLEPTQVAGFNQFYSGVQGESEWRYGLGLDGEISPTMFFGVEASKRDINTPFVFAGPPQEIFEVKSKEYSGIAYFYWAPRPTFAVNASYRYDEQEDQGAQTGFLELHTHRVPLSLKYFHPSGVSAEATATYVDQDGEFLEFLPDPPFVGVVSDGDSFVVLDAAISYRLPRRMGIIAVSVDNALDEEFRFQDVDPSNPDIIPERLVSLKLTIAF